MAALTEANVQALWADVVDCLERLRVQADTVFVANDQGGVLQTVQAGLQGDFMPAGLAAWVDSFRSGLSSLISPSFAREALEPILFDYLKFIQLNSSGGAGVPFGSPDEIMDALWEHFKTNSLTVESRAITYDTTPTTYNEFNGGTIVGDSSGIERLTVDEGGFNLEACHVETKKFRCIRDENTGTDPGAALFEVIGDPRSFDNIQRNQNDEDQLGGSGISGVFIREKHAGSGDGGSILRNSSFSSYNASGSPKFSAWTEDTNAGSTIAQSSTAYRLEPGASTAYSLAITATGTVIIRQDLTDAGTTQLDPKKPYFLRVMASRNSTSADGTLKLRLGTEEVTVDVSAQHASNWFELALTFDASCYYREFFEADLAVDIELTSPTTGTLLIDDVILVPWDEVDGTFWVIRDAGTAATYYKVGDTFELTDTGGAAPTAKIQYWNFLAGFRSLPSTTGTPTFTEP